MTQEQTIEQAVDTLVHEGFAREDAIVHLGQWLDVETRHDEGGRVISEPETIDAVGLEQVREALRGGGTESTFSYEIIDIDDLRSTDLYAEAHAPADADCVAALVTIGDHDMRAEALFYEAVGRGGVVWGADADWTDANSIEDLMERYLGIGGKEMAA